MEREFRIRTEILYGRTAPEEQATATADSAGTAVHSAAVRTGADSSVGGTSYERGMERADILPLYAGMPDRQPDRLSEEDQWNAGTAPDWNTDGRSAETDSAPGVDDRTGWEAEREIFLAAQAQIAQTATVAPGWSDMGSPANDGSSVASALVGLGRRLEQSQSSAPVTDSTTMHHYADRKMLQKEKEKKIALGQKEDDHEEEQNWQQTM